MQKILTFTLFLHLLVVSCTQNERREQRIKEETTQQYAYICTVEYLKTDGNVGIYTILTDSQINLKIENGCLYNSTLCGVKHILSVEYRNTKDGKIKYF